MTTAKRPMGNPNFKKGVSGNPAGKPKGCKDKRTMFRELVMPYKDQLIEKAIQMAVVDGDAQMMKLLLERILPAKPIDDPLYELKDIHKMDLKQRVSLVLEKMGDGIISPSEAKTVMNVVDGSAQLVEMKDLKDKVDEIADAVIKDK